MLAFSNQNLKEIHSQSNAMFTSKTSQAKKKKNYLLFKNPSKSCFPNSEKSQVVKLNFLIKENLSVSAALIIMNKQRTLSKP